MLMHKIHSLSSFELNICRFSMALFMQQTYCSIALQCIIINDTTDKAYLHGYSDTRSDFEAAIYKLARRPSQGVLHLGKFLEPKDEIAGRGCC